MVRKGGPLPGPEDWLLPNTRKWIVQRDPRADKARAFIGKGMRRQRARGRGDPEGLRSTWLSLRFCGEGVRCRSFWLRALPRGTSITQDGSYREGFWELGRTYELASSLSFGPVLNYSGWGQPLCFKFFTRSSCCRMTPAGGYYGAWLGQVVWDSSPNVKDFNRHSFRDDTQMVKKHMKRYSALLVITKMPIKTTMRYHFMATRKLEP